MKKILALTLTFIMLVSACTSVVALNLTDAAKNHYEVEDLNFANQGEASVIEGSSFSGGKAVQLKATNGEDWIFNDYVRFYAPIWQSGWYEVKAKVRKGPDCGIIQLWASDTNLRWGDKIDMYSPTEEIVEVTFVSKAMYNLGESRWFEFRVDGKNAASSGYNFVIDTLDIAFVEPYEAPGALYPNYTDTEPVGEADTGYEWGQVMEGGSGRSLHVQFHPKAKDVLYLTTDMGGAYRWENSTKRWTSITDFFPTTDNAFSLGVDGLALDPNNPDILYMALGTNSDKGKAFMGKVAKSTDGGKTWTYILDAYFDANDTWRNSLGCIAVDPNNSNVVMVATMDGRLIRSEDGFKTWRELTVPFETKQSFTAPRSIAFDPTSKDSKGSKTIYLGTTDSGLWVSNNYGESFERIPGCPIGESDRTYTMNFSNDGTLLIATKKLYKKDPKGVWTEITPVQGKNFVASNIYPTDSNYMATAMSYNGPVGSYGEYNYISTDGGATWKLLNDTITRNNVIPRVEYNGFFANTTSMSFDPYDKNRVAYCGWQNFYMVEGMLTDKPVISNYTNGIEQGCERKLFSMPVGARLIQVVYDYGGGRFTDVTQYMPYMLPSKDSNPTEFAFSENNPNYMVRVGKKNIYYSTDNGINWRKTESVPACATKEVMCAAVSADVNPETGWPAIYAVYGGSAPVVSVDNGKTWAECPVPAYKGTSKWARVTRMTTDKKDNGTVYYLDDEGTIHKSTDYGKTFNVVTVIGAGDHIETMFGTNYLFVNTDDKKLYYSTTNGELFKEIGSEFDEISDFGFGKEEKAGDPGVVYIIAMKDGVEGVYRSQDVGKTWVQIYNDATATDSKFSNPLMITGDRQTFGIVYVGSSGRGIFYGCPDDNNIFYKIRNDDIKVLINGQTVMFDVSPQLINDRTMVPMRKIFEDVGAKVDWDEATQTVTAVRTVSDPWEIKTTEVKLTIGENKIYINGEEKTIDVAPVVINDRTLVPVRFISEALGGIVEWIDDTQIVKITI